MTYSYPISSSPSLLDYTVSIQRHVIQIEPTALEAINAPAVTSSQTVVASPLLPMSEVTSYEPSEMVDVEKTPSDLGSLSFFFQLDLNILKRLYSEEEFEFLIEQLDQLKGMFFEENRSRAAALSKFFNSLLSEQPPFGVFSAEIGMIVHLLDMNQTGTLDQLLEHSLAVKALTICGFIQEHWENQAQESENLLPKIQGKGVNELVLNFAELIIDTKGKIHLGGVQTVLYMLKSSIAKQFAVEHLHQMQKILKRLLKRDAFQKEVQKSYSPHPDFADEIRICLGFAIDQEVNDASLRRAVMLSLLIGVHQINYQGNCPIISSLIHHLHKEPHEIYAMLATLLSKGTVSLNQFDLPVSLLPLWKNRPKDYRALQSLANSRDLLDSRLFQEALSCVRAEEVDRSALPVYGTIQGYIHLCLTQNKQEIIDETERERRKDIVIGMLLKPCYPNLHQILIMAMEFAIDNNPKASRKKAFIDLVTLYVNGLFKRQLNKMDADYNALEKLIDTTTDNWKNQLIDNLWLQRMENPRVSILGGRLFIEAGKRIYSFPIQNLNHTKLISHFSSYHRFLGKKADGKMIELETVAKAEQYIKEILNADGFGPILSRMADTYNSYADSTISCTDLKANGLPDFQLRLRGGSNLGVLEAIFKVSTKSKSIVIFQTMPQFLKELFFIVKGMKHDYVPIETTFGKGHSFNLTPKYFKAFLTGFDLAMNYSFFYPAERRLKQGPIPGELFASQSNVKQCIDRIKADFNNDPAVRSAVNFYFYKLPIEVFTSEKIKELVLRLSTHLAIKFPGFELPREDFCHQLYTAIKQNPKGWDSPFLASPFFQKLLVEHIGANIESYDLEMMISETFDLPLTLILGHLNWEGDVKLVVKYDFYENKLAFYKRSQDKEIPFLQEDLKWLQTLSIYSPGSSSNTATVFQLSSNLFAR